MLANRNIVSPPAGHIAINNQSNLGKPHLVKAVLLLGCVLLYFILVLEQLLESYESISVALFVYWLFLFLYDLGRKLIILDVIILSAIFSCLIMPLGGFHYFTSQNMLARLWVRYMRVTSEEYYSFMFPATLTFIAGLKIPVLYQKHLYRNQEMYLTKARTYVGDMSSQGLILIGMGIFGTLTRRIAPAGLEHVFSLMSYLMFVGVFYCIYSKMRNKKLVLISIFTVLIVRSILDGMFGELIFMTIMTTVLMMLGKRYNFFNKLLVLVVGTLLILIIQVIKPDYRAETWRKETNGREFSIFMDIAAQKITNPSSLLNNEIVWFNFYSRFNQGMFISMVQNKVPRQIPYANGETIYTSLAGSIVPRILWPDKPEAGGAYNFKRFLGIKLVGYSVGISPYGEAWGNFGKTGGIVFMFFFGLLFNFIFSGLLKISLKTPSLVLWFPIIFFYAVKIETDIFTMVNSLTQAIVFTWLMYKFFPKLFRKPL